MSNAPIAAVIKVFRGNDGRLCVDHPNAVVRSGGKVFWYSKTEKFGVVFMAGPVVPADCGGDPEPDGIPKLQVSNDDLGEVASPSSTIVMEAESVSQATVHPYELLSSGPIVRPPRFMVTVML